MRHIGSTNKFLNMLIEYGLKNNDKTAIVYCRNMKSVNNYISKIKEKLMCNLYVPVSIGHRTIKFNDTRTIIKFITMDEELRGNIIDKMMIDVYKVENMQFGYLNSMLKDTDIGDQYLFGE